MKTGKKLQKLIERMVDKLICIKDVTDPEYMKYNSFSIYMGLLFIAMLAATFTTAIQGQYSFLPFIIGLTIVAFFAGHDVRKRRIPMKQLDMTVILVEVLLTVLCPVLYMVSGGLYSATTIWFFLVLILTFITLEGSKKWIFFIIQLVLYIGVLMLDRYGVVLILGKLSTSDWYLGTIVSLIVVSISVGGYISFQISEYMKQQKRLTSEIKDISLKKQKTEDLLEETKKQKNITEKALKTQSDFLLNMNQEIRTPLNAIIGLSEVISKIDDVDQIHELTKDVTSAAKGLGILINDILEYSATGDNRIVISPEPYNTDIIVNAFRNMCVPLIEEKGLEFEQKREKLPKLLMGDFNRTQQVLFHIANNAIKYTDKGKISFGVKYDYEKQQLILTISDTGIGIREEDMPYIFEQYRRVEKLGNNHLNSAGISLALSKKIIEKMGGSIAAESVYGEGSTFVISIPQSEVMVKERTRTNVTANNNKTDLNGRKIMYVDNGQANHLIIEAILSKAFATVECETTPKAVLNYTDDKLMTYDAYIVDYVLAGMDGAELMSNLRNRGVNAPVIAVSDELTEEKKELFSKKGFDGFVSKPFKGPEVYEILNKLLK